jgi:dTDP-glucose pyrophosphorylase
MAYNKIILNKQNTIKESLEALEENLIRMCIVINENHSIIGTITDGDIRRALLMGFDLSEKVTSIMNANPVLVHQNATEQEIDELFERTKVEQLPCVDADKKLIKIVKCSSTYKRVYRDYPVVIMAGGKGQRLWPLTEHTPKPMLVVGDKPILESIIDKLTNEGFYRFYISVNYKAEIIKNYFGNGSSKNINIQYIDEDEPLGTAGALGLIKEDIDTPVIVMNGDIFCDASFGKIVDFHINNKEDATICVGKYSVDIPYGVVEFVDGVTQEIKEKPELNFFINSGIYVLNGSLLKTIRKNEHLNMTDFINNLVKKGHQCHLYPFKEIWIDIGHKEDLKKAQILVNNPAELKKAA